MVVVLKIRMSKKKTKKEIENYESPFLEKPSYTEHHPFVMFLRHLRPDERPKFYYNNKGWLVMQVFTNKGE